MHHRSMELTISPLRQTGPLGTEATAVQPPQSVLCVAVTVVAVMAQLPQPGL